MSRRVVRVRGFVFRWTGGAGLAVALLLTGLFSVAMAASAVEEAARREGRVSVYAGMAQDVLDEIAAIYEDRYGVSVDHWRASATIIADRVLVELRAGRPEYDVVEGVTATMQMLRDAGALTPFRSPAYDAIAPDWEDEQISPPFRLLGTVILYNNRLISEDELPASYMDLLDPKWEGRIVMADPARNVGITLWLHEMRHVLGEDYQRFLEGLARQRPALVESFAPVPMRILSGEYPIGIGFLHYVLQHGRHGAPIDYVRINPVLAQGNHVGVAANAQNPHAARLFVETLFSREAAEILAQAGELVSYPGVYPPIPDVDKLEIREKAALSPEEIEAFRQELHAIFSRR